MREDSLVMEETDITLYEPKVSESGIFIDYDRTIFDTDQFIDDMKKWLNSLGIDKSLFDKTYRSAHIAGIYIPKVQFVMLSHEAGISYRDICDLYENLLANSAKYVFPDVPGALEELSGCYELDIISYGEKEHQMGKIKNLNLEHFFEKVIITNDRYKLSIFNKIFRQGRIILVDDRVDVLSAVKSARPDVLSVCIDRSRKNNLETSEMEGVDFLLDGLYCLKGTIETI